MQRPPASAPLVALIDEDVWVVRELSEELQKRGYRVVAWNNPTFAVELLKTQPCDAIVTEGTMAVNGADICAKAIETYGEARPGFVLHTAHPRRFGRRTRAIFDEVLEKPATPDDLVAAIERARAAAKAGPRVETEDVAPSATTAVPVR